MIKGAIAAFLAIGLGIAAIVSAVIESAVAKGRASKGGGDGSKQEPGIIKPAPSGEKLTGTSAPTDPSPSPKTMFIHPMVDEGLIQSSGNFAGGTLTCMCSQNPVTVTIKGDVAFNHACGCTKC